MLDKIRLGEDSTLELKAVRFSGDRITGPEARDLADELAAFRNFVSGVVALGVDDKTGSIDGVPENRLDLVETTIRDVVNDRIEPPLPVRIERLELPDLEGTPRAVVRIDVPRSLFVHRSPGGYLYRLGSSKRQMTPEMLARLFQQRSQTRMIRFDEQPVSDALPEAIEADLWRRFVPEIGGDEAVILRKLRLLVDTDGGEADERLSVAAVLMCTSEPHRWLRSARIEAVHYRGLERDSNYQRDARTITGPLDHQVTKAHEWVLSRMSTGAAKDPGRAEVPQFSPWAIFRRSSTRSRTATTRSMDHRSGCSCSTTGSSSTAPEPCPTPWTSSTRWDFVSSHATSSLPASWPRCKSIPRPASLARRSWRSGGRVCR